MPTLLIALQWLQVGQQVIAAGAGVWSQIQAVLRSNGIEADTSALDEVIADAERRKAIALAEAGK